MALARFAPKSSSKAAKAGGTPSHPRHTASVFGLLDVCMIRWRRRRVVWRSRQEPFPSLVVGFIAHKPPAAIDAVDSSLNYRPDHAGLRRAEGGCHWR